MLSDPQSVTASQGSLENKIVWQVINITPKKDKDRNSQQKPGHPALFQFHPFPVLSGNLDYRQDQQDEIEYTESDGTEENRGKNHVQRFIAVPLIRGRFPMIQRVKKFWETYDVRFESKLLKAQSPICFSSSIINSEE